MLRLQTHTHTNIHTFYGALYSGVRLRIGYLFVYMYGRTFIILHFDPHVLVFAW